MISVLLHKSTLYPVSTNDRWHSLKSGHRMTLGCLVRMYRQLHASVSQSKMAVATHAVHRYASDVRRPPYAPTTSEKNYPLERPAIQNTSKITHTRCAKSRMFYTDLVAKPLCGSGLYMVGIQDQRTNHIIPTHDEEMIRGDRQKCGSGGNASAGADLI